MLALNRRSGYLHRFQLISWFSAENRPTLKLLIAALMCLIISADLFFTLSLLATVFTLCVKNRRSVNHTKPVFRQGVYNFVS